MAQLIQKFVILKAKAKDAARLAPLFDAYRQFYGQAPDVAAARRFLKRRLLKGESTVFLAVKGASCVGFIQLYPTFSSISIKPFWILSDLFVALEARKQGIAALLLKRARKLAVETGASGLALETAVDNAAAQRLYKKLGWKKEEQFHRYNLDLLPLNMGTP